LESARRRGRQLLRAFGRRQQSNEEFFSTADGTVQQLLPELQRFTGRDAALEIGCGPGRLMRRSAAISRKSTASMSPTK